MDCFVASLLAMTASAGAHVTRICAAAPNADEEIFNAGSSHNKESL